MPVPAVLATTTICSPERMAKGVLAGRTVSFSSMGVATLTSSILVQRTRRER